MSRTRQRILPVENVVIYQLPHPGDPEAGEGVEVKDGLVEEVHPEREVSEPPGELRA